MKKVIAFAVLLLAALAVQGQTSNEGQVRLIRQAYAEAKARIARNGKNGQAPRDMKITLRDDTQEDDDFSVSDMTGLTFYFSDRCYFIVEDWSADGHTRYREFLFDDKTGSLVFSFMKAETHAGFEVESRYYYDTRGNLVDQKHKVGGQNAVPGSHEWSDAEGDKALAAKYIDIFQRLVKPEPDQTVSASKAPADPDRMKVIRSAYAEAKAKIAKNDKSDVKHDMHVVIRNQSWGPPETTELNLYFDVTDDGSRPLFFVTEHRHHNKMGPESYSEYLFEPDGRLMFSYTSASEEGEKCEWRYYFNASGQCIEVKTSQEEQDNGRADKQAAARYLRVFQELTE